MRLKINEITPLRIGEALLRRATSIPDLLRWKYSALSKKNQHRLNAFKDRHKDERCFIIANGPSLKDMDLAPLKDEITIGMNRIYMAFNDFGFKTTYLACINELVLEQFTDDFNKLDIPIFINWKMADTIHNRDTTHYLKIRSFGVNDKFSENLCNNISSGGTVTYASLQIAYYMGFSEVIIIGMDHNFKDKGTPNKTEVRSSDQDENHFNPNYFPKGMKWQLPDLYRSEQAYALAKRYYDSHGRKIYDATVGGKCDVFQKKDFKSFFSNTHT